MDKCNHLSIIDKKQLKFHVTLVLRPVNTLFLCFFSADIISCVEFNNNGELLATGDKGGRVVIFQRDGKVADYEVPHLDFPMVLYI